MSLLVLVLAAAIDPRVACARYGADYVPPPAAVAAAKECGEGCERDLAESFANGQDVEQDFEIAEYFLCRAEDDLAPAEFEGMFEHLQKMRSGDETAELHFCDHVTSGRGMGECASARHSEVMPKLEARLDALRERLAAKEAFDVLRQKGQLYVDAEALRIGEQSRGGTGYAALSLEAEMDEKEKHVARIERWSNERAPAASAADLKQADATLNEAYHAARRQIDDDAASEILGMGEWKGLLRDAQRAWIAYRDAFASFYAAAWRGKASADGLRREIAAQLTRDRAAELKDAY